MNNSTQTVTPASPVASPATPSGATGVVPVPAIVMQEPTAKAASPATVKHSRSSKGAAPVAAPQKRLSPQPMASSQIVSGKTVQTGIELSPELASMSQSDIANAFMGKKVEAKSEEEQKKETESTSKTEEEEETEEVKGEVETEQSGETTEETEHVNDSPVAGIAKELTEKGVSPKLVKRITDLAKQNSERGELLKRQETKPFIVLSPSPSNPLANVTDEAKIDEAVKATQTDARAALRKLERMGGVGGTWDEGGENERELTSEDVDVWITHFEDLRDNATTIGQERKAYLKSYAETVQALDKSASDLVSPKVETRESKMVRLVPEIMRDPEYLRFLADAQTGREIREKKAKGVQTIEIDTKAKAKSESVPAKASTSNAPAKSAASVVQSGFAGLSLDDLRTKAAEGNSSAQAELMKRFMAPKA